MKPTLTIRLSKAMRHDLEGVAKIERIPMSDLVREALRRTIAVHRFRRLRKMALPYGEARGFLTDEDVFNAVS